MATTTNLLNWEAFEQLPDDGMHHAILAGELIALPPPKSRHCVIAHKAANLLRPLEERQAGVVFLEAGYRLSQDPATWIQPGVSFLKMERVRNTDPDGYFLGAPELAVEVVSPSESARMLNRKIAALLAAGSMAVWLFLIFEDQSGRQVDFDLVDSNDLRNRAETTCPLGPGRFAHARGAACVSEPRP